MGLFDALPPPKSNGSGTNAVPTAAVAPTKRPADGEPSSAAGDSSKKARSTASLELPSGSSDSSALQLPPAGAQAGAAAARAAAGPGQPCWTALEAAYSEDSGSRLTMEGEQQHARDGWRGGEPVRMVGSCIIASAPEPPCRCC